MDFGRALQLLQHGRRVARAGWNGKGMYIVLIKGEAIEDAINDTYGCPGEAPRQVQNFLMMKTAQDTLVPWVVSQSDTLADDWNTV